MKDAKLLFLQLSKDISVKSCGKVTAKKQKALERELFPFLTKLAKHQLRTTSAANLIEIIKAAA